MTADDKLTAFFTTQEPPAYDAQFMLRSLTAFQRREMMHQLSLVALVGVLTERTLVEAATEAEPGFAAGGKAAVRSLSPDQCLACIARPPGAWT